jgi:SPP1 family predicted phage head-tail adaptor
VRRVKAGKLRHLVAVERLVDQTPTAEGQPAQEWAPLARRYAAVEPVEGLGGGREYLQANALQADLTHQVTVRYLAGVTPKMRVNFGGRILEVISVGNVEERDRMTVLWCKEKV